MSPSTEEGSGVPLDPPNHLGELRVLQQERWPNESMRLQSLSWALIAVGRYREAQQAFNEAMGTRVTPPPPSPEQLEAAARVPLEAADTVVLRAAEKH